MLSIFSIMLAIVVTVESFNYYIYIMYNIYQ